MDTAGTWEGDPDPKTVFITGISYALVGEDIEKTFSEIGPVRKCFLLQGKGHHKGCGFVNFALAEDAQRAVQQLNGRQLGNRTIQVEEATRRAPNEVRKERKRKLASHNEDGAEAAPADGGPLAGGPGQSTGLRPLRAKRAKTSEQKERGAGKQRLVRTVALGNLTAACSASALALAQSLGQARASHGICRADSYLAVPSCILCSAAAGESSYPDAAQVEEVVYPVPEGEAAKYMLHRDGCAGQVAFLVYDSVKSALQAVAQLHNRVLEPGEPARKSRKAGASAGTLLWSRQVSGEGLHMKKWRLIIRNLAFDVKESQLQELLRPAGFVWELTIPRKPDGQSRGFGFAGFMCRAHAEKAIKVANGQTVSGRTVVVDWAVPKAQYTAAAAAAPALSDTEGGAGGNPAAPENAAVAHCEAAPHGPQAAASDGAEAAAEPVQGSEKRILQGVVEQFFEREEAPRKLPDKKPRAAAASLHAAAKVQGGAGADQAAGRDPSGNSGKEQEAGGRTVFVRGLPLDVSQFALQDRMSRFGRVKACRLVLDKQTRKAKGTAFVEFETKVAAQKAVDACARARQGEAPAVAVSGCAVEVDLALSQDAARTLAASKVAVTSGSDNRNLYLAKEGAIEEGSAAWAAISAADRTKRRRAAAELQSKLKSPNFFVSRTRLCVRNLPYSLDEKQLKMLLLAAVKERAEKARPMVKQVKVLRDAEKVNAAGEHSSKGLAFVDFGEHEHALCALRQLNNNPAPFGEERRPIVEFAVENAQTLKKRSERSGKATAAEGERELAAPGPKRSGRAAGVGRERALPGPESLDRSEAVCAGVASAVQGTGSARRKRKQVDHGEAQQPGVAGAPAGTQAEKVPAAAGETAATEESVARRAKGRSARQQRARLRQRISGKGPGARGVAPGNARSAANLGCATAERLAAKRERHGAGEQAESSQDGPTRQKEPRPSKEKGAKPAARRRGGVEKGDNLDSLVERYKAQLFGEPRTHAEGAGRRADLQRWFE